MLSTMAALNDSFGALAENFFASMFKFSPIKGFLLGKRIGKFYKNLLEGFEKSKLSDLLKREGYNSSMIAVECNGSIIPKSSYEEKELQDGDSLEVVSFVGGG